MTKKRIGITDGGIALPLGNNTFLMRGRLHSQGGIGIGNGGKNDIEVEDGEVVRFNKNNIQVLSDQPMLNGISPANALLAGGNFNKIFKAQQSINGNHHGSYGKDGLIKKLVELLTGGDNKKENTDKAEPLNLEELKLRQAYAESAFDSNARSNKDAVGLFQIRENLLTDYNNAHGTNYTLEDLYDDKLNMSVRDWKMDKNLASDWAIRNNAPDSVVYAKSLGGYNMGNQNFLNHLGKAKAAGVDIYNSMDWISEKWLPKETVDYINFILRNQNNSISRNQFAYEASKKKNSDKVEGIRNGFRDGGRIIYENGGKKNINNNTLLNAIKQRLYEHIYPSGYQDATQRILGALFDKDDVLHTDTHNFLTNSDINSLGYNAKQAVYRDDLFATYLGIPKNKRRNFEGRISLINSNYKPTVNKLGINSNYYTFPKENIDWNGLLNAANGFGFYYKDDNYLVGKLPSRVGENFNHGQEPMYNALGEYTIGRGYDPNKGEYISLYDLWDISPFGKGDSEQLRFTNSGKKDKSFNIGTPVQIYDRMYLDDYYGLINNERGGYYIPEVTVTPKDIKVGGVTIYKNGGQINMKLKHKNKQDITDIVMNEILPHSTGERKKFVLGGSEIALMSNAGLNLLSGLGQGIAGSINASNLRKMYDGLKRQSTFIPVTREHINTKINVEPQLNLTAQTEYNLRRNAEMNTASAKVARSQARVAALDRIRQDNAIYSDKYNRETQLRNAEAELQTKYNLADLESKLTDIREQNDFDMQKAIGKANAGTMEAQTWGNAIASTLGNTATSLMDYTTMQNDLLKSDNTTAYDQWFKSNYGHLFDKDGKLKLGVNGDARRKWFNDNKATMDRLGYSLPS